MRSGRRRRCEEHRAFTHPGRALLISIDDTHDRRVLMDAATIEQTCEYSRCPARYQYELEIYERWFRFCMHHSNVLLDIAEMPRVGYVPPAK
jgi:hypothetical protein